jgi:hypothetical protein
MFADSIGPFSWNFAFPITDEGNHGVFESMVEAMIKCDDTDICSEFLQGIIDHVSACQKSISIVLRKINITMSRFYPK